MQIGIQDQAIMEQRIFFRERFLDLYHHIRKIPYFSRAVNNRRTGFHILRIRKSGADACSLFHIHLMSGSNISSDVVRRKPYSEFIILDFFDTSDLHS